MGSRANRARRGTPRTSKALEAPPPKALEAQASGDVISPPIPDVTAVDLAFGNTAHMPRYDDVPDDFKQRDNPHVRFISKWFFNGLNQADMIRLVPRPSVETGRALAAIRTILTSFEPKHEHKEAACVYLLSSWFELRNTP